VAPFARRRTSPFALAFAATLAIGSVGCAGRAAYAPLPPPRVARPLNRVVPLRIVQLVSCDTCTTECARSCRAAPRREDVIESVERANETFAPTGVRFSFRAVERIDAPIWWRHGARGEKLTWAEVRPLAKRIFPWMPDDAWRDPHETKTTDIWLEVLVAAYARPEELTVFVQQGGGNRGETHFPNGGRGMWVMDGMFGHGPGKGHHPVLDSLYLFGHELGHYMGLRHTFGHHGTHPVTHRAIRFADRWDLVYHPGSGPADPHVFFTSREDAYRYAEGDLRLIERMENKVSNCREEADGAIECVLPGSNGYSETHRSGSPALQGLSFPLGPEGGRYRWARNALSYGDMEIPRRLSASQIELVRLYLQYDMNVGDRNLSRWGRLPSGMDALDSHRTTLGLAEPGPARPGPAQPGLAQPGVAQPGPSDEDYE
jgi:hypothetical protein